MGAGSNGIIFDDLSDPQPGFQGHGILISRNKNGAFRDKVTKEH